MTITKSRQSDEVITKMGKKAFPDKTISSIKELTEGMCNVTYHIVFTDGFESILKIASKDQKGHTSNEVNLMQAEVRAMKLAGENCSFRVADVFCYDCSGEICDSDYFFMEKLPGVNYIFVKDDMPEEVNRQISMEMGEIAKELSAVHHDRFGFLGEEKNYTTLYEFVKVMLANLISDADRKQIDIACNPQKLMEQLEGEMEAFGEVQTASLVHWDMWEGNVFIENDHISGIIDWERAVWGEPFMDDRFRHHNRNKDFLKGYGQTVFSETEVKRLRWYDIILYLTMMIEVFYREYEDQGQYLWAKEKLCEVLVK